MNRAQLLCMQKKWHQLYSMVQLLHVTKEEENVKTSQASEVKDRKKRKLNNQPSVFTSNVDKTLPTQKFKNM